MPPPEQQVQSGAPLVDIAPSPAALLPLVLVVLPALLALFRSAR